MAFPYPGEMTEKLRQNVESVRYRNPLRYIKIEFTFNVTGQSLGVLPKDAILDYSHLVFIEDFFDGAVNSLIVGTNEANADILTSGDISIDHRPQVAAGTLNGRRTTRDLPIFIGFNGTPTKGRGWLILKYILWSRI